jgi:hypothetical protein
MNGDDAFQPARRIVVKENPFVPLVVGMGEYAHEAVSSFLGPPSGRLRGAGTDGLFPLAEPPVRR